MKHPSYTSLDLRRLALAAGGSPPPVKAIVDVARLINRGQADREALQPVCDAIYGKGVLDADEIVLSAVPTAQFHHTVDGSVISVGLEEAGGLLASNVRWTFPDGYIASGVASSHDCAGVPKPWRMHCAIEAAGGRWTDTHIIEDENAAPAAPPAEEPAPAPAAPPAPAKKAAAKKAPAKKAAARKRPAKKAAAKKAAAKKAASK